MSKRLRVSLDVNKLTPDQVDMVLAELGEHISYNVTEFSLSEHGTAHPLHFGGERVGQWKVVEIET